MKIKIVNFEGERIAIIQETRENGRKLYHVRGLNMYGTKYGFNFKHKTYMLDSKGGAKE